MKTLLSCCLAGQTSKGDMRVAFFGILALSVSLQTASATTYYVKNGGSDGNNGLSDANAWSSLAKVNTRDFNPGDRIRLKSGSIWTGPLNPKAGSDGTAGSRIVLDAYNSGTPPRINPNNLTSGKGVNLTDLWGWTFRGIKFASSHRALNVKTTNREVKHILVDDCEFVNCSHVGPTNGSAPAHGLTISGTKKYTDIRVERNTTTTTVRAYVIEEANGKPGFYDLDIKDNTSASGDSGTVFVGVAYSGVMERNTCFSTRKVKKVWFGVAGGRVQNSGAYLIRHNTWTNVKRFSSSPDGVGFDFEGNNHGTIYANNDSINTDGAGILLLGNGGVNTGFSINDCDITNPCIDAHTGDADYSFTVKSQSGAHSGNVLRGRWEKGSATDHKSPKAISDPINFINVNTVP